MEAKQEPETYHPKIRFGKPVVIVREHERIVIERRPRDGREAVVVTIQSIDSAPPETVS